jgi:thiamine-monophosphate kinase
VLRRSGVGATLALAQAPQLLAAARTGLRLDPSLVEDLVFAGGDDYELAFTAPAARRSAVLATAQRAGTAVTRVGSIDSVPGLRLLDGSGLPVTRRFAGFDHFAASRPPATA